MMSLIDRPFLNQPRLRRWAARLLDGKTPEPTHAGVFSLLVLRQ